MFPNRKDTVFANARQRLKNGIYYLKNHALFVNTSDLDEGN